MTPERLSRIRAIYEAAIDLIPAARPELIKRECADDSDLRQEVQRLITVRENLPQWLADPAVGPVGPVLEAIASAAVVLIAFAVAAPSANSTLPEIESQNPRISISLLFNNLKSFVGFSA